MSLVGRVTLLRSILNTLPMYSLLSICVMNTFIAKFEQLCKAFLLGNENKRRGMHLVSWDVVTRSARDGGLGIRRLKQFREVVLGKKVW